MATLNPLPEIKPTLPGQPSGLVAPTVGVVDSNRTVQGQMTGLLSQDSPLLNRAKTRAAQEANRRGLLNSAMGVQAGEEAVLTAALPIAQQDASTYDKQALTNQDWQNKFAQDSNNFQFASGLSAQENAARLGQIRETAAQDRIGEEQKYQQQIGAGTYAGAGLISASTDAQSRIQQEKAALDLASQTQSESFKAGLLESEYGLKSNLSTQESEQRISENMADLQKRFENTKALLPIENQAKLDQIMLQIQGNRDVQQYASTSQILTQFQKTVGDINSNKDLDDASRKKRIEEAVSNLNANIELMKDLATDKSISIPQDVIDELGNYGSA